MIAVTLNFVSLDAALHALREIPQNALAGEAPAPKSAPPPAPAAAPATAKAGAAPKKTAESQASTAAVEGNAAAAPSAPEAPAASPASSSEPAAPIDYATLQKAVFALAGKSRDAAASVAQSFGVKTFKDLPHDKWAAALAAVQAKTAEL